MTGIDPQTIAAWKAAADRERGRTDFEDLRRIIEPIVKAEHAGHGLLTFRFEDGTRLSFLCGTTGRLDGVVVQHGSGTPELRLPKEEAP